jgi:phosphatidylglycerophosphatase A
MTPKTDAQSKPKPRLAFTVATALGLGYLPKAPGTFGSLFGSFLAWLSFALFVDKPQSSKEFYDLQASVGGVLTASAKSFLLVVGALAIVVSLLGVWAADRVANYLQKKDPQIVVVDEVAGQLITYLGLLTTATFALNWKYLLAGFILFRVFDIWKPFPARQAESLPGGLGIMADDWVAGLYAALVLALARHLGL